MAKIDNYSFKYFGKMDDAMQSLPLGNGDVGANVWVCAEGDVHLLISKTDAWSELNRLLKLAHIVIKLEPSPFLNSADFELSIAEATLKLSAGGVSLLIYADAFAPCVRVLLESEKPISARAELLNYRNEPFDPKDDFSNYYTRGGNCNIAESADVVLATSMGGVAQIHRNEESCYAFSLKTQHMESYLGRQRDPLLGLTFGVGIYSPNINRDGNALCASALTKGEFSIFANTRYTDSAAELADALDALYNSFGDACEQSYSNHAKSWREFWNRAYIYADGDEDAERITRAFLYQRYMTHCADRGNSPIKFNGSIFTADQMNGRPGNYDARRWGGAYWFQNTRIPYWYLLGVGDYESMLPMFDMYLGMLPIAKARCENYFGHAGILIPETVSHFGLYANLNYGYEDEKGVRRGNGTKALRRGEACNGFIRYHYNGMLELSYMMLKYLEKSGDSSRRDRMLEFIEETLLFFDRHFDRIDGKMYMNPVASLETWQMCVNDAPDIAGLLAVCKTLSVMPDIPASLKALVEDMITAIPQIPLEASDEGEILAPCEIKILPTAKNSENPELYAVFPFEIFGLGKEGLDIARRTYDKRAYRHLGGWSQDPVDAALLGLTEEAEAHLIRQSAMTDERALFPAFWGPNFDDTPDQDHGGMTALALILMLLQTSKDGYTAFPAWPEKWNVRFRLPWKKNSFICGEQISGIRTVREEKDCV